MSSTRFAALLAAIGLAMTYPAGEAVAQDTWQYHMAQANNYYRNHLLPKALEELKAVVESPDGAKQQKPWELIVEISSKLKDIDSLIWGLEQARERATGQQKAQYQAQLYRLKRGFGRVVYQAVGGSGKLSKKGVKIKSKSEIGDPEALAYFEKARATYSQLGISKGSYYLPVGDYLIDGEEVKIVGGKDTIIEVAPTTFATLGLEVAGMVGGRGGAASTGLSGFAGGIDVGVGPHIQFSSGNSLLVQVGPVLLLGPQSTPNVQQDAYENDNRSQLNVAGRVEVGLEFGVGNIDISPRVGYLIGALPSGMYYRGTVVSNNDNGTTGLLDGHYIVPAIAHGPRVGLRVLMTPAVVKTKRRPRVFAGFSAGPTWLVPQWGESTEPGSEVGTISPNLRHDDPTARDLAAGTYTVLSIGDDQATKARIFVDIEAVIGVQLRLGGG